jgi:hypothetical protein
MRTTEKWVLASPEVFAMQIAQVPGPGQDGNCDFAGIGTFAVLHRQEPSERALPQFGQTSVSSEEEQVPAEEQQVHDGGRKAPPSSVSEPDWLRQDEHEEPCEHCGSAAPTPVANRNATRLTVATNDSRFWLILGRISGSHFKIEFET